jgi:hypothetical protein
LDDDASSDEDSDTTPSVGGILPRLVSKVYFDYKAITKYMNQSSSIGKRQRTEEAADATCLLETTDFTSTLDVNAVDLQIGDCSSVRVSKAVLGEVRYFNTFFSKNWEQPAYSLSGDDPFALKILLAILHHKLHLLPLRITFSKFYELATVCDKYDASDIVAPHVEIRDWISPLWKDNKPCLGSWASWLWICNTFQTMNGKSSELCRRVLDVLAANMRLRSGSWYIERGNSPIKVSNMKCPSKLDPLQGM